MNRHLDCLDQEDEGNHSKLSMWPVKGPFVRGGLGGFIVPGSVTKTRKLLCRVLIMTRQPECHVGESIYRKFFPISSALSMLSLEACPMLFGKTL